MTFFKTSRTGKDLEFIKNISEKIEKKLSQSVVKPVSPVENMTVEELQDLHKIAQLSNFMLTKYEDKKEVNSILKYFVSIIQDSAESIEKIDDEVSELIISAEDSINKIKEVHTNISEKYDIQNSQKENEENQNFQGDKNNFRTGDEFEDSAINLTKIAIEINSQEYQQNSTKRNIQVI